MREMLAALDHPIVFVFFLSLAVAGMLSILTWGAKAADLAGAASVLEH